MDLSLDISDQSSQSHTSNDERVTDCATIKAFLDADDEPSFQIRTSSKFKDRTRMSTKLIAFLCNLQDKAIEHIPQECLPIFTRHKQKGQIFHAHPNFHGQGPWKHWVIVDWGHPSGKLPRHISCFVELNNLPSGNE